MSNYVNIVLKRVSPLDKEGNPTSLISDNFIQIYVETEKMTAWFGEATTIEEVRKKILPENFESNFINCFSEEEMSEIQSALKKTGEYTFYDEVYKSTGYYEQLLRLRDYDIIFNFEDDDLISLLDNNIQVDLERDSENPEYIRFTSYKIKKEPKNQYSYYPVIENKAIIDEGSYCTTIESEGISLENKVKMALLIHRNISYALRAQLSLPHFCKHLGDISLENIEKVDLISKY